MDSFKNFFDQVYSCFPYVLLAMAGSAVRWLNKGLSGGVWGLFVSNITAGFVALLCGLSAEFLHLESGGVFFLSGMAGFMGGSWVMERFTPLCGPEGYEWRTPPNSPAKMDGSAHDGEDVSAGIPFSIRSQAAKNATAPTDEASRPNGRRDAEEEA